MTEFSIDINIRELPASVRFKTGDLYFRCDEGNPGTVFSSIEFSTGEDRISVADDGYNTIDNIHFRCFGGGGMDCNNHSNIVYQNCEADWCGGVIQGYDKNGDGYQTTVSGGGMLLFGNHLVGRNNYIHDCESKGIAVVINGNGHISMERKDILAYNNIVERCGASVYMMTEFIREGINTVFEDVRIDNNYLINGGNGWRAHNMMWIGNSNGTYGEACGAFILNNVRKTGEVVFSNNVIYNPIGYTWWISGEKENEKCLYGTSVNNIYVNNLNGIFFCRNSGDDTNCVLFKNNKKDMEKLAKDLIDDQNSRFIMT